MKVFNIWILSVFPVPAFSQSDMTRQPTFNGFTDAYFAYDFNQPETYGRPGFLYKHNQHNEFNINLAFLKAAYYSDKVRSNLAQMAGTYAQYNLAAEPDLLQNIYGSYAGVRLRKGLWLDAVIFASHFGLESAISKENYNLTRNLAAENAPWYGSSAKITYAAGRKWLITGLVLNGWQSIGEQTGNSNKALGMQIQFKPSSIIVLNASSSIGNDKPDNTKQGCYFHDFYATFQIQSRLKPAAVFDLGAEKRLATNRYNICYTPPVILHNGILDQIALGDWAEYYQDKKGVILTSYKPPGFQTTDFSINLDDAPADAILLRLEGQLRDSKKSVFVRDSRKVAISTALASGMAVTF